MKLARIAHIIWPRSSNNHKARILHNDSLILISVLLVFLQLGLNVFSKASPSVLGYASQIPPSEIIRLTNQRRADAGVGSLSDNPTLDKAAQAKGADMLNKGYWAHVAPDGTTPWQFFNNVGYKYKYAGENLARDFSDPASTVSAWMASPTHKENLLSPKYKEIGVAVVEGNLNGVDTTIVVQLFGTTLADSVPTVPVASAKTTSESGIPEVSAKEPSVPKSENADTQIVSGAAAPVSPSLHISPFSTTKYVSLAILGLLIVIFITDAIVVARHGVTRISGRNAAHVSFLGMLIVVIVIMRAGQIL